MTLGHADMRLDFERSEVADGQVAGASGGTSPIEGGPKCAPKSSAKVRAGRGEGLPPTQRQQKSGLRQPCALHAAAAGAVGGDAVADDLASPAAVDLTSPASAAAPIVVETMSAVASAAQMSPSKAHASVVTAADSRAVYLTPLKKISKNNNACRMILVAFSDQITAIYGEAWDAT